ncbi:BatA domain-containing protein [Candidatus Woesearchaeota archaeon]|nr:BatA domain-containing protein [Candidatus Woesearchaeota archaeon]
MVFQLGPVQFSETLGLYALLSIVPLILLYLIRPRPKPLDIPSLMFFTKARQTARLTSFLRRFVHDFVMLVQILFLALAAFSIAKPFTIVDHDLTSQNTIIVLDTSASSTVREGSSTRLDIGIAAAKRLLGSKNTVILAKGSPLIGLQDAEPDEASRFLDRVKARDTPTRLGEAIMLGAELLAGKEGRVIAISDFINTEGVSPAVARTVARSKGVTVDFINTAEAGKRNAGFIDLAPGPQTTVAYIKNFDNEQRSITLNVNGDARELSIPANSVETLGFQTPSGTAKLELKTQDDFMADNVVWLSAPERKPIKVLLISNNASTFVRNALTSSDDVQLTIAAPPIVPKDKFDVYVLQNLAVQQILPGTFEDIAAKVDEGASLIIHAQDDTAGIDYGGLSPVRVAGKGTEGSITIDQLTRFTKNVDFGSVDYFFAAVDNEGATRIASVRNNTVISMAQRGKGKTVFYGILEGASDFRLSPGYPIFWQELLRLLTDQQDIKALNYKTGASLVLDAETRIETPTGSVRQRNILLDTAGFYRVPTRTIAANLLNEHESDINPVEEVGQAAINATLQPVTEKRNVDLEYWFVLAAAVILLTELVIIKARGDV